MKVPHTPKGNVQLIHEVSWLWMALGPEKLVASTEGWSSISFSRARSEENEKWKQNWTKQMRAGALGAGG